MKRAVIAGARRVGNFFRLAVIGQVSPCDNWPVFEDGAVSESTLAEGRFGGRRQRCCQGAGAAAAFFSFDGFCGHGVMLELPAL